MSIYNKYLFINPPNGCDPQKTSDSIPLSHAPSIENLADLYEMYMRRKMIELVCANIGNLAETSSEEMEEASKKRLTPTRFPHYKTSGGRIYRIIGDQAIGTFDAADANPYIDGIHPLFRACYTPIYSYNVGLDYEDMIRVILEQFYAAGSKARCFLDPKWTPPQNWGCSASHNYSYVIDIDNNVTEPPGPSTRYTVPSTSFFTAIYDTKRARPLKSPVPYYNDDGGSSSSGGCTVSVKIPPYYDWIDPDSAGIYRDFGGVQVGVYGMLQSSNFEAHALEGFKFEYYDYIADDPEPENLQYGKHLEYLSKAPSGGLYYNNSSFIPKLNTDSNWWDKSGLTKEALDNICQDKVYDAIRSFYVPPAFSPMLTMFGWRACFPPDCDWDPSSRGYETYGWAEAFLSKSLFAQTVQHAQSFLKKLTKVVIPVTAARVQFSKQGEITDTNIHKHTGEESQSDSDSLDSYVPPPVTVTHVTKDVSKLEYSSSGWSTIAGLATTRLDSGHYESPFKGFMIISKYTGDSIHAESKYIKSNKFVSGSFESHQESEDIYQVDAATSFTIKSIKPCIPGKDGGDSYRWEYRTKRSSQKDDSSPYYEDSESDSGEVGDMSSSDGEHGEVNNETEFQSLLPDWIMPFVKKAELFLSCEGYVHSWPGAESSATVKYVDNELISRTGSATISGTCSAKRKVISLGVCQNSSILEFSNTINLRTLLDSIISVGSLSDAASPVGPEEPTSAAILSGSAEDHYESERVWEDSWSYYTKDTNTYKSNGEPALRERGLQKASLFMVVDFDPDADITWPW